MKNNSMNFFFFDRFVSLIFFAVILTFLNSCNKSIEPQKDEIIMSEYPKLADEIMQRDFEGLWEFANHENDHVKTLALKAIGKSEAPDLQYFVDFAIQEDDSLVWHSLSLHPLENEQVQSIEQRFANGPIESESVCNVFFKHGTSNTLEILLDKTELLMQSEVCAKAVGGIVARVQIDDLSRRQIFDLAFNSGNEIIWRNLLYGFYRSDVNRPAPGSILNENIATLLDIQGDRFTLEMDRYITRISGMVGFRNVMARRSDRELNDAIQLSNELARNVILFENDELNHPNIKRLLNHNMDNVVAQTLQSLQEFDSLPEELLGYIEFQIAAVTRDAEVFAEALTVLSENGREIDGYRTKLEFMDERNEYLKHRILPLYAKIESDDDYLNRLRSEVSEGGIGGLRSVQALMNYFTENPKDQNTIDQVRTLTRFAVEEGDRSVISALPTLLGSPNLFDGDSFEWMFNHYESFVETSQWEKANVLEEVFNNRFPEKFEALTIPVPPFRKPKWDRLYEMGSNPYWVLETEKGTIEIQLDPLTSPFTVSSIDSLTRAGAYDDVPFHRVVRSFVIQGGDVDRKDGFGGPDYRLPTEPSFKSFERGKVGIASSGTDTEGSQFFVMLNWSPHLDGNYTIFGNVTKGMNVADRIQVGDRVIKAKIYSR